MNLIIPKPIFGISLEPQDDDSYRYKGLFFPIVIKSPILNPWGICWEVDVKIIYGKNKERTKKYPASLRIQLIKPVEKPDHSIEWLTDSGKFAYYQQSCDRFFAFSGTDLGWLIVVIKKM
jgi:hypothetical protein